MDWGEFVQQFSLGNAAILTNVCMLPLYPGLIAFLAGNANNRSTHWLGFVVLAGILTMMVFIGFLLYTLRLVTGDILPTLLPIIYVTVIVLGVMIASGRNPFARISTVQSPVLSNPYLTAYTYGLLLAPMTLPCTGAFLVTQFTLGAGSISGLTESILYVIAFGLGFGWPLVVLPFFAVAAQRKFTGWLAHNHMILNRVSGALLIIIGLFGLFVEVLPNTTII